MSRPLSASLGLGPIAVLLAACLVLWNAPSTAAEDAADVSPQQTHSLDVLTYNLRMIWCFPEFSDDCSPETSRADTFRGVEQVPFQDWRLGTWEDDPTKFRARRIAERLLETGADVLILTEAAQDGPVHETMLPILERRYPHHTPLDRPFEPYYYYEGGIVILSQHPIRSAAAKVLNPRRPDSARGAVHAEISNHGKSYDVFGVHIWPDSCPGSGHGCSCEEKKEAHWEPHQKPRIRALGGFVTDREERETPTIIAGDFNVGTGLHECGRWDRSRFRSTLEILDAIELAHPRPTIGRPDGRILDHILLRNVDPSSTSSSRTLTFETERRETGIGESRRKLSDHHPVRARLDVCEVPTVVGANLVPSQEGGARSAEVELAGPVRCPGLKIRWQVAPTTSFENPIFEETDVFRRAQPETFRLDFSDRTYEPDSADFWRLQIGVGPGVQSDLGARHQNVVWALPSYDPIARTSPARSF